MPVLGPDDPHPVRVSNPEGPSPFLLVSDHAGRRRPAGLGRLGVGAADWDRHVAYDIGIKGVGAQLARMLDAALIEQRFSRLVIDCNRPPGHPDSIPSRSERVAIPANQRLDATARTAREAEILHPYQAAIAAALARRRAAGRRTILVALHSFTPVYEEVSRPWHAGVLHDGRAPFAHAMLAGLAAEGDLVVGDNQPYRLSPTSDYTVPLHAWTSGLDHVELEVRQDLITVPAGQSAWATRLARILVRADEGRTP